MVKWADIWFIRSNGDFDDSFVVIAFNEVPNEICVKYGLNDSRQERN